MEEKYNISGTFPGNECSIAPTYPTYVHTLRKKILKYFITVNFLNQNTRNSIKKIKIQRPLFLF